MIVRRGKYILRSFGTGMQRDIPQVAGIACAGKLSRLELTP
jgi:hypothetical protein